MISDAFLETWTRRLRAEIPGTVAIILKGSQVRGNAGPYSDVDFDVLVEDADIAEEYPVWFADLDHRLVHVSVAVDQVESWLGAFDEPAEWAFGFPSQEVTRLLWAETPTLRELLDRPWWEHPAVDPELEDAIEELGKARNARLRGDELAVRLAVQELATLCPTLLAPLNQPSFPGTRPEALRAALAMPVSPAGYRGDMLDCLGLSGHGRSAGDLLMIAERLVDGSLALLEEHADAVAPKLPSGLATALADGTLRRYLNQ